VSAPDDSRAHLRKAKEFLEAAVTSAGLELCNAATSAAVTSGINSKDAICLALTGTSTKSDNHSEAVRELKAAGPKTGPNATTLGRLLKLQNRSQYQAADVAGSEARKAIEWATRLVDAATETVLS
jgi:hypothetical protein